jgi:hypothetical protein
LGLDEIIPGESEAAIDNVMRLDDPFETTHSTLFFDSSEKSVGEFWLGQFAK